MTRREDRELAEYRDEACERLRALCGTRNDAPNWADIACLVRERDELRAAQPEYLSGCQLRGPGECERIGMFMCQSQSCKNAGKVIVKRVCVEPKEAGIVYPKVET